MPGTMISTLDIHRSTRSILQSKINPSDPFIADDFLSPYASYDKPAQKLLPDLKKEEEKNIVRKQKQKNQKPRSAFNMFSLRKDLKDVVEVNEEEETDEVFPEDVNMTTPLHEAARLGAGALMRFLLESGGDANVKNGHAQTALHTCCGGVTKEEYKMIVAMNVANDKAIAEEAGIRAPVISKEVLDLMNAEAADSSEKKKKGKKGVQKFKAVSKMLMRTNVKPKVETNGSGSVALKPKLDFSRLHDLAAGRIDAALTLLSWSQKQTGVGVSLNAVDDIGRTSLHYAAEMGRAEICNSIMANFGTMFTIVDEIGSLTPCECAARHGHKNLAAQLEARALLYVDPYGLDEELMASVKLQYMDDEDGNALAPPYNWFKTLTTKNIEEERKNRLTNGRDRLLKALQQYESNRDAKLEAKLRASNEKEKSANDVQTIMKTAAVVGLDVAVNDDRAEREARSTDGEDSGPDFSNMQDAHIERLFAYHRWDTFEAVDAFRKNPIRAFRKAQIQLSSEPKQVAKLSGDRKCPICIDNIEEDEKWLVLEGCSHTFCTDCLQSYVKDRAKSMTPVSKIMCPEHGCTASISQANIDTLLANQPKTAARVEEATTRHFVSSAYDFKFCNAPGCTGVVKRLPQKFFVQAGYDPDLHDYFGAVCTAGPRNRCPPGSSPTLTYDGVEDSKYNHCKNREQPQRAHRFCFACGETMHWPCPCDKLKEWQRKMREEIGEVEEGEATDDANELAQRMWIKANTRSCPHCEVLIEKNDGCNHMTCVNPNCRYEFW
jgi:ankyrin repeat protein